MIKDIKGFEGRYQIHIDGSVISRKRTVFTDKGKRVQFPERILKPYTTNRGYFCVVLAIGKKQTHKLIHRLIAEHFIPNPLNLPCVNHIDENKQNNDISNLEWTTAEENSFKYFSNKRAI